MTTFVKGRTVRTAEAVVTVDAGLELGTHRFQLVVVRSDGRQSAPDVVEVVVSRRLVIDPLQPPVSRPPIIDPLQPPVTRPPVTRPPVTRPPVTRPPVTPVVTPIRTPATPRKNKASKAGKSKPSKPRSEK